MILLHIYDSYLMVVSWFIQTQSPMNLSTSKAGIKSLIYCYIPGPRYRAWHTEWVARIFDCIAVTAMFSLIFQQTPGIL